MPCSNSPDFHQKSFRINRDDEKLFSRLVSKESSKSNYSSNSFRVPYYTDVPSAVPFLWETRPGTPKHTFSIDVNFNIPPLTPPPSCHTNVNLNNSSKKHYSRSSKLLILRTLLRRMRLKKDISHLPSSPNSLSSPLWSSSSHSSFSDPATTPTNYINRRRRFLSCGSSFEMDYDRDEAYCPSRMSSGIGKNNGKAVQSGSSVLIVKKAFLSFVGRGSA
ncbi:hypothetical protein CDL12_00908 [Handroanthus impetiginosus]|uniref:Uncharacterized protein n=1 Tax=Handroanthus impetiginosus TaxID=429701 RepID=A0A2G9I990_9LAMI|nr:hypothetical protein CDL12_00908 [Handroanthus impetiginosus]